ncbi:MAG: hypothetical protein M1817_004920 [Caeruleum heppii]|nr:MAG: hypothetical protein M1817_004920 [Caeruleum heppii]
MGQSLSVPRPSALDGSPSSQSVQASSSDSTVPSEADEVSDTDTPFDAAAGTSLPPDAMREINRASTAYNSAIDALQEDNEALDVRVEAARRATLLRMNIDGSNGEASSLPTFTGILPPLPIHSRYVAPAGNSSIPREPALAAGVTPAQSELARAAMATSVPAASGGPTPQEDPVAAMANALGVIRQLLGLPEDAGARVRRATPEVLNGLEAVAVNDLGEEERVCPICQERFGDTVPFNGQPEAPVRLPTSCRHVFGSSCIRTWLAGSCTCPLCRERMASEDGAAVEEEGSGDESDSDLMVFSEDESDEL